MKGEMKEMTFDAVSSLLPGDLFIPWCTFKKARRYAFLTKDATKSGLEELYAVVSVSSPALHAERGAVYENGWNGWCVVVTCIVLDSLKHSPNFIRTHEFFTGAAQLPSQEIMAGHPWTWMVVWRDE